jgi:hypothetical protein
MNKHGEVLLSWEGSILIVKVKGPFNDEGAIDAVHEIKKSVYSKNIATWYRLGFWDEEALGSPSTFNQVKEIHEWSLANGCKRTAVVVCNSLQHSVLENLLGGTVQIFRIEADAKKWLLSQSKT